MSLSTYGILGLVILGLFGAVIYFVKKGAKSDVKRKVEKSNRKAAEKEADRWRNVPSPNSIGGRLRKLAERAKRKGR